MTEKTWNRADPLEDAIWRLCDYLQCEGWNLTDDSDGGIPNPDEMFPDAVRSIFTPLLGDGLRQARIAALKSELARLEAPHD